MRSATEISPEQAASRLAAYRRDVQSALPGVEKMILFGSRARNQAHAGSDYDIAVVVRDLSDRRHVRRVLSDLAYDHILSGFYIRPIPLPSDYLQPNGRRATELAGRRGNPATSDPGRAAISWQKAEARLREASAQHADACTLWRQVCDALAVVLNRSPHVPGRKPPPTANTPGPPGRPR